MIDQAVSAEMLEDIPLLNNFNVTERRQMADIARLKHFAPGEVVVRQGEDSQTLWVVLEGKCEVVKHLEHGPHNSLVLAILEPFSHFGEMSFFSPAPHSASVRAQTAVTVLGIDRRDYDDLIRQGIWAAYKLAYNTVRSLADRLRRMDEWVAELAAHNPPGERIPEWSTFRDKLFNDWNVYAHGLHGSAAFLGCRFDDRAGTVHTGAVHVQMGNGPHESLRYRQHQQPSILEDCAEFRRRRQMRINVKDHDVRLDPRRRQFQTLDARDRRGELGRVGMVDRQTIDVMLQRVERRRGQHAGLTHAAPQQLAMSSGKLDELARTGERRSDRRPQPLAEADAHGVEVLGPIGQGNAGGHGGIPEPSAVQVGGQPDGMTPIANVGNDVIGQHSAGAPIVRVLKADQPGAWKMIVLAANQTFELLASQDRFFASHRSHGQTAQLGVACLLVVVDVAVGLADDFVSWRAVESQSDLVGHGARGDEDRPLLAQQGRHPVLERANRGVFAKDVIADDRVGHGRAHGGRGPGDGVAP